METFISFNIMNNRLKKWWRWLREFKIVDVDNDFYDWIKFGRGEDKGIIR